MKSKVENGTDPIVEYFRKGSAASHLSPDDFRADYFTSARHLHLSGVAAAPLKAHALLEHAAKVMKAEGKTSLRSQSAPGAVEKRSRDGGETQPSRLPG
jgi:2-dehydro-3-deoxygluconokinase